MNNNAQQPIAARAPADSVTAPAGGDSRVPEAWTNLLAYVLQDDLHNRLTPRVIDIAYTAFMQAKRPNDEDGGASDWFNDTRPIVREFIAKLRKDLIEELVTPPAQAADSVLEDAAFEAVRKQLCTLPRYSFCLDDDGVVRRVQDRTGNWIEFDDAHKLFDPIAVDAARKQGANHD